MASKEATEGMEATDWTIARQFNRSNVVEFRELLSARRLRYLTTTHPVGSMNLLTPSEAEDKIAAGYNVYADVAVIA